MYGTPALGLRWGASWSATQAVRPGLNAGDLIERTCAEQDIAQDNHSHRHNWKNNYEAQWEESYHRQASNVAAS
eukprot:7390569-Prymnesium_polylepis.2